MKINMPVREFCALLDKVAEVYPGAALVPNKEDIIKIEIGKNMFLEFHTIGEFKNFFAE